MRTNKRGIGLYLFLTLFFPLTTLQANTLKVEKVCLSNGLLVLLKEDHTLPLVSLQAWIKVGSAYETEINNGVSHFLEHMLFKKTKKYGIGEIARVIESQGGRINAGTGKDATVFYINIPKEALDTALGIVSEVIQNATFPEEEIERERLVILEEIKRHEDNPEAILWDVFNQKIYPTISYHFRIIGNKETIQRMSREMLMEHYRNYYVPNNITFVIVGDISVKRLLPQLRKIFEPLPRKEPLRIPILLESRKQSFFVQEKKSVQQAYFIAGFLGPTVENDDQYALDLLATILGQGRNSRLYKKLREEKELVWSISTSFFTQKGSGIFLISGEAAPEKVGQAMEEIYQELLNVQKNGINKKELARAKILIESGWLFGNETYSGKAYTLGYGTTLKNVDYAQKYLKNISRVQLQDIKRVFDTYFQGEKPNTIIFYPE